MIIATWNGQELAKSDNTIQIEGNHYFPPTDVNMEFFYKTEKTSICPWKGEASYYSINVNGEENTDAAWTYHQPKETATERVGEDFSNYIAFWNGVDVKEV